ncbi:MAG: 4'-phosphopantetheinyl transferase superfamily protein [Pseudomonadota bacterium]
MSALSEFARKSAYQSALKSGVSTMDFKKDEAGVPQPLNGIYWSVSHKPDLVGGVVSKEPVGIDVEKVKKVSNALFNKILDTDESNLFSNQEQSLVFFRTFTAKEAVLKKTIVGIKGLSKTRVKKVVDNTHLVIGFEYKNFLVEHFYLDEHIASVTKDLFDIHWTIG